MGLLDGFLECFRLWGRVRAGAAEAWRGGEEPFNRLSVFRVANVKASDLHVAQDPLLIHEKPVGDDVKPVKFPQALGAVDGRRELRARAFSEAPRHFSA